MISTSDDFQALLAETGITIRPAMDFAPCPVLENSVFAYQFALRSPSGEWEFRYRIDSHTRLEAERKAPDGMEVLARVSLDELHEANFMAIVVNVSRGRFTEPRVMSDKSAALLFGADWSALSYVRLADNDFAPDYDSGYVLAIHKAGVADAYIIGLYCDDDGARRPFDGSNPVPDLRFA